MNSQNYLTLSTDEPIISQFISNAAFAGKRISIYFPDESPIENKIISASGIMHASAEEEDFSIATYAFFYIGCIFLVLSVGLVAIGYFITPHPWAGVSVCVALIITSLGFRQCVLRANNDKTETRQKVD